jgi:hypothetical protein
MDVWTFLGLTFLVSLAASVLGVWRRHALEKQKAAKERAAWEEMAL